MEIQNCPDKKEVELICMIVNFGLGSKAIKIAKKNGVSGGTVFLGRGTIKNRILEFLELNDSRKEINDYGQNNGFPGLDILNKELGFHKPNHGIAFTFSVAGLLGSKSCHYQDNKGKRVRKIPCIRLFLPL